jgi:hypothetical protein
MAVSRTTPRPLVAPNHSPTIAGLKNVSAEMSLSVLAYNLKRTISLVGVDPILMAIRA